MKYNLKTKSKLTIMKTIIKGKEFQVKQQGNRFYYWSVRAGGRWLPVKKADVICA